MRVLYLNPFSQEVSGPDESLRTLLQALIPLGVEAHVVLPRPGPQVPRYEALGARLHFAPMTCLKRRPGLGVFLLPIRLVRGVSAVTSIVLRERIDLIHTNMEVVLDGAITSRLLRIPHVLHYRGNTNDDPKLVFDALTQFWTRTAEKVFCISNATAAIFRTRGLTANVETLYNPIDVSAFSNAARSNAVRSQLGASPSSLLVGTVARIHPRKDIETFVRTAALLARVRPDARFAVIGAAEALEEVAYESSLRSLAADLGIADRLCWSGARRDMPAVLKALDVLVLCSRNEGFGRVVAEALASGTPVVASREGAMPELLEGVAGARLVQPGVAEAFCSSVLQVAEPHPPLVAPSVRAFDNHAIARRVRDAYERAARP